jgi:hypothetical protein
VWVWVGGGGGGVTNVYHSKHLFGCVCLPALPNDRRLCKKHVYLVDGAVYVRHVVAKHVGEVELGQRAVREPLDRAVREPLESRGAWPAIRQFVNSPIRQCANSTINPSNTTTVSTIVIYRVYLVHHGAQHRIEELRVALQWYVTPGVGRWGVGGGEERVSGGAGGGFVA